MGLLKNARKSGRDAPAVASPAPEPTSDWRDYHLAGVRFTQYRKPPAGQVNVMRLAAADPATWSQVWRCIKRSRPQLAALLMDPQLERLKTTFNCEGVHVDFTPPPEVDMLQEAYYIDTRDGANGPFTPPPKVDDCSAWLRAQYAAGQRKDSGKTVYFGFAQKVNALVHQAQQAGDDKTPAGALCVRVIGPHAIAVREFLSVQSGGLIAAEVLS